MPFCILGFLKGVAQEETFIAVLRNASRSRFVIWIRLRLGWVPVPLDFDDAYKIALMDFERFHSIPVPMKRLMWCPDMRTAFRDWWFDGQDAGFLEAKLHEYTLGGVQIPPELLQAFQEKLRLHIERMPTVYDKKQDKELRGIRADLETAHRKIEQQGQVTAALKKEVVSLSLKGNSWLQPITPTGPVDYNGIRFSDRRQSEFAAFLDHHESVVQWTYDTYQVQDEPGYVRSYQIFGITDLGGTFESGISAITLPMRQSVEDEWDDEFEEKINKLSEDREVIVVLRVPEIENFDSPIQNMPEKIRSKGVVQGLGSYYLDVDVWRVDDREWKPYNWYLCDRCERLSIIPVPWRLKYLAVDPKDPCPLCVEEAGFCERCGERVNPDTGGDLCDSCDIYIQDKIDND